MAGHMKWIFRWVFRIFMALVVLAVAAILLLDTIAREFVEYQIHRQTGMETRIGKVHIGLADPQLSIEDLVIYNPAEFGGGPFVEMPELHVEYDRDALAARKLHCKLVRFNLASINIVEDKTGKRNDTILQARVVPPGKPGAKKSGKSPLGDIDFAGIDTLNLTLGKVTYRRMQQPQKVDEYKLHVDHQIFTGIKSIDDFNGVLMVALLRTGGNLFQSGGDKPNLLQLFSTPKK